MVPALIRLARPTHWVKNGFVAGPLIFANPQSLGEAMVQSGTAVAVFSLMASAIYCFNDVIDAESDRAHPTKRTRPIAAGLVSPQLGVAWGALLAAAAIALAWFRLPPAVLGVLGAYVINNVLYNARIKTVAIADVISIATGFVLRLVAGAIATVAWTRGLHNVWALIALCNGFVPLMKKRGWGRVINLSSGIQGQPNLAPYSVSKAAVDKYTRDLAADVLGVLLFIGISSIFRARRIDGSLEPITMNYRKE
jgi:4-hydroxybenzoate polyprenyltransferase